MCVSGESTSLSCNNLSAENIGSGQQGKPGLENPAGPPYPMVIYLKGESGFEGGGATSRIDVDDWIDFIDPPNHRTDVNFQATWTDVNGHAVQCIAEFLDINNILVLNCDPSIGSIGPSALMLVVTSVNPLK